MEPSLLPEKKISSSSMPGMSGPRGTTSNPVPAGNAGTWKKYLK
jgi:hypothetical protein